MTRAVLSLLALFFAFAVSAQALPNLVPYRPDGWSAPIVIAKTSTTFTDSSNLTTGDDLWFSYAVANVGDSATPTAIQIWLYVDGVQTLKFGSNTPVQPGTYTSYEHYNLGKYSAGTHTLKIVADATNAAAESDETDNEYTKTITVNKLPGPNLKPATPPNWSAPIVVSNQAGTNLNSSPLKTTDKFDIDVAFTNDGTTEVASGTPGYHVDISVDHVLKKSFTRTVALAPNAFVTYDNVLGNSLGSLAPGYHYITLTLDSTNVRKESNESDNTIERLVLVRATPDLNVDYKADIVLQNVNTGVVKGLLMGANGTVSGTVLPFGTTGAANLKVVGMADFNGDGLADVVRQNASTGAVTVSYLNTSGVVTGSAPLFSGPSMGDWKVVAIMDLNGDGHDDLLLRNAKNQQVKGYLLDANGALVTTVQPYGTTPLNGIRIAGGADVNGDGRADILRQGTNGKITASILTGNASVQSTMPVLGGVAPGTMKLVGTTDLNADGIEDLVLEDPANGSLEGEIMDGTGNSVSTISIGGGTAYGAFKVKG